MIDGLAASQKFLVQSLPLLCLTATLKVEVGQPAATRRPIPQVPLGLTL